MLPKRAMSHLHESALRSETYEEIAHESTSLDQVLSHYREGARGLYCLLRRSLRTSRASPIARLQINIETHKPQHEQGIGPIHASHLCSLASLGKWLALRLDGLLNRVAHLVKGTESLVEELSTLEWDVADWHQRLLAQWRSMVDRQVDRVSLSLSPKERRSPLDL